MISTLLKQLMQCYVSMAIITVYFITFDRSKISKVIFWSRTPNKNLAEFLEMTDDDVSAEGEFA